MMRDFTTLMAAGAVCAALTGVGSSPGMADATTTALLVGGHGSHATLTEEEMSTALGGYFGQYDTRIGIPYVSTDSFRASLNASADLLYKAIYDTPGFKTIGGVSEGSPTVGLTLERLMYDLRHPEAGHVAPDPSEMNVAVYGYLSREMFIGSRYIPLPVTPYNVFVIKAEYDAIADFPDRPFNLLAVANAIMGADQLHYDSAFYDVLTQPTKYSITTNRLGGTTTTIMIPTPLLPLLTPLKDAGMAPDKLAKLDKFLRPMINRAYRRPRWQVGVPPTLLAPIPTGSAADATTAAMPTSAPHTLRDRVITGARSEQVDDQQRIGGRHRVDRQQRAENQERTRRPSVLSRRDTTTGSSHRVTPRRDRTS